MNRRDEALAEFEQARHLDPVSLIIYSDEARALAVAHHPDRAIPLLKSLRPGQRSDLFRSSGSNKSLASDLQRYDIWIRRIARENLAVQQNQIRR